MLNSQYAAENMYFFDVSTASCDRL